MRKRKQKEHIRLVRTKSGRRKKIINKGNRVRDLSKRFARRKTSRADEPIIRGDELTWDLEGYNSKENNDRWRKYYEDKSKVPSVKDIMGEEGDDEE